MIGRRVSDQRPSRKGQVAETLLKAKEKLVNATSEVTAASLRLLVSDRCSEVCDVSLQLFAAVDGSLCWFVSIVCTHSSIKVFLVFAPRRC